MRRRTQRRARKRRPPPARSVTVWTESPKCPTRPISPARSKIYLGRSLKAYKTGERKNPQMSVVAATLSDDDIANLSAYFASIKITVQKP